MWKRIFMISMFFLVLAGIAIGSSFFMKKDIVTLMFKNYGWIVFAFAGISAVLIGFSRDTYLPFLGETVIPCSLLKEQIPENANHFAKVKVRPGAKVMYWAAEPANSELHEINDWRKAYLGFKNAGVVIADENGIAKLQFRKPQQYKVSLKGTLQMHVHYRSCLTDGMLGRVETVMISEVGEPVDVLIAKAKNEAFANKDPEEFENEEKEEEEEKPEKETKEGEDEEEGFQDFSPAEFPNAEAPKNPTNDNSLYYLAAQTEEERLPESDMGIDESPQAAGSDYEKAFLMVIPQ